MKRYSVVYVDAFSAVPYAGNPCAVVPQAEGLTEANMQAIARETNLSETAFVFRSVKADFRVRYFTPRSELPFAGHPTIATAFMLAEGGQLPLREPVTRVSLEFKIGVLPVDIEVREGKPERVIMTQKPPEFGPTLPAAEVAPCFGLAATELRSDVPSQVVSTGVPFLIVPATRVEILGKVRMDREALGALVKKAGVSAAFMISAGGFRKEADIHARFFDPAGTSEDSYTGSAMGAAGCFVVRHGLKSGPTLLAEQGHFVGRPGEGVLEISGTAEHIDGVRLGGAAVRVLEGSLFVPA